MKRSTVMISLGLALLAPAAMAQNKPAEKATKRAAKDPDKTLQAAYRREFAFLVGQEKELKQRLAQVNRQTASESKKMEGMIAGLEGKLLRAGQRVQDAREALTRAEHQNQSTADDGGLVEATLDQSKTTLKEHPSISLETAKDASEAEQLKAHFSAGEKLLKRLSRVRVEDGDFFKVDGKKTTGKLLYVGQIAAYGVAADAAGVLAPAGDGRLKQWPDGDADAARALAQGNPPAMLPVFLYERLDAAVQQDKEETALQHVDSGGTIAWVIVGLGVLGLLLVAVRALLLWRSSSDLPSLEAAVGGSVQAGSYVQAKAQSKAAKGAPARVLGAVLDRLEDGDEDVEDVVSEQLLRENRSIQRFGAIILVIAAVAPLLGLLGTVTGMISTFDIITKFGTGDPKMLSGGISTALVTTELGLIVAIPMLLLGNLLKGWSERIESDIERAVLSILNVHKEASHPNQLKPPAAG